MSFKKVLFTLSYLVSTVTTILFLKYTHSCDCLHKWIFYDISNLEFVSDSDKWTLMRSWFAKIALYIFAHTFFVMSIRVLFKKSSPATQEDPDNIKLVNRIILNTLEQSAIFIGLYGYFLFDRAGDRFNKDQLLSFPTWFIIARIFFSIGYTIGTSIGVPVLRAIGFGLNLAINILLAELCFCDKTYLNALFLGQ